MDWYPDSDESTLVRTPIRFATGFAPPVAGSRWFRDADRRDIQGELPGWPAGPQFTLHPPATQAANRVAGGLLSGLATAIKAGVDVVTGSNTAVPNAPKGKPQHPADEVEDFPVMWAAPGTRARTLPWQLDPGRRPDRYRVDAVVTDRRLVLLGVGSDMTAPAEVLWEAPRDAISGAEQLTYSEGRHDLRIRFTDDSWVRLSSGEAQKLVGLLSDHRTVLPESGLTAGQRERVARFVSELPATAQAPRFFRLASGVVLVEAQAPAKAGRGLSETHSIFMGETGEPARPQPGDL